MTSHVLTRAQAIAALLSAFVALSAAQAFAEEEPAEQGAFSGWFNVDELPNAPFFTLGGIQFWTDQRILDGWRIQRHALTGHCRLLDAGDVRRAWGTEAACRRALDDATAKAGLEPPRGRVVVLLHGLLCGRCVMEPMAARLRDEGYEVVNFGYSSTQAPVADHARALAKVIDELDEAEEIFFVGHSLGNIVVRHYLADQTDAALGRRPDPRIRRIVMLGPPNHGSARAVSWSYNPAFALTLGPSAVQLATHWDQLAPRLATPDCEFGVIAGGRGDSVGFNPILPGDDDGTVTVDETRLDGAKDFTVLPVMHFFLLMHSQAIDHTISFLRHGRFDAPQESEADDLAEGGDAAVTSDQRALPTPPGTPQSTLDGPATPER